MAINYEYDFQKANKQQKEAIKSVEGPLLITAGPGTGKTYTLVQRTMYMILKEKIDPSQIWISTYTNKAAKELITRLSNEFAAKGLTFNINEMYIGTFHGLCLRILNEYIKYTDLKQNYSILDNFGQNYLLMKHEGEFFEIDGFEEIVDPNKTQWEKSKTISELVNKLREELVEPEVLIKNPDGDAKLRALGEMLLLYRNILYNVSSKEASDEKPDEKSDEKSDEKMRWIDFSGMQTECWHLLNNHPEILKKMQQQMQYFMVDEYQDTNHVQNEILFLLAGDSQNICVVGDDDQSIYRFRGATVRNILEFEKKIRPGECKEVTLTENYRSSPDIIRFYNEWMENPIGFSWKDEENQGVWYRRRKTIKPHDKVDSGRPAVFKLETQNCETEWHEKILAFIKSLKITDYNQIAVLANSVKDEDIIALADYLKDNGIPVNSSRSNMFFERKEIQLLVGCLLLLFPDYSDKVEAGQSETHVTEELQTYYLTCKGFAETSVLSYPELKSFLELYAAPHRNLKGPTDYSFSGLVYRMFAIPPFSEWLSVDMQVSKQPDQPFREDILAARNLALFTQIIAGFERTEFKRDGCKQNNSGLVLTPQNMEINTYNLFSKYLKVRYQNGVSEYEDEVEYAPSGHISFMTIHQAKGMEFPIVIIASLWAYAYHKDSPLDLVEKDYFSKKPLEPIEKREWYDFWRLYYTAFSRAQNLLVLAFNKKTKLDRLGYEHPDPSEYFVPMLKNLKDVSEAEEDIKRITFAQVKSADLKPIFSFTAHIAVYERCSLQYKFLKELGFAPHPKNNVMFGILVHETIEDIHRAVLRQRERNVPLDEDRITPEHIEQWFEKNYNAHMGTINRSVDGDEEVQQEMEPEVLEALEEVKAYANAHKAEDWDEIRKAEVSLMLPKDKYILSGRIDLIQGKNDSLEILDFKWEKKKAIEGDRKRKGHYKKQLQIYAHLVKENEHATVSGMRIYCTKSPDDPWIEIKYDAGAIENTIAEFGKIVDKILDRDFAKVATDYNTCRECDFKYYCERDEV